MATLSGFRNIVRALRNPNFGLYTAGNSISLVGTWMQRVVTGWLAWELTGSGTWLGLVAFADLFPTAVIGLVAGAYADRWDRLRVTMVTQFLSMLQAVALLLLTATGTITPLLLLVLTLFLGIVSAFNQPARLALLPNLVPRADLPAAVAVNSVVLNLARFLGPAAAGLIIATLGIPVAYAANALTFLPFLVALSRIRLAPDADGPGIHGTLLADLGVGLRYAFSHPGIAVVLVLMIANNLGARPLVELLPGFAAEVFRSGATGLALLTSSIGVGAVFSGVWIGGRAGTAGLSRILLVNSLLMALATALFTATASLAVAVPVLALTGFSMAATGIAAQTLIQLSVAPAVRGRVLSIYGILFRGGPALGALLMGAASEKVGLRLPIMVGCLGILCVWTWARLRQHRMVTGLEDDSRSPGG